MKKLFFSFVILVTLVIVGGSAMAQTGSTMANPYVGSTYTYTVNGVTGSFYGIYVTATSVTDGSTASTTQVASSDVSVSGNTGTSSYSNSNITATINWKKAGSYRIWAVVMNAEGCYNFVYKDITVTDQTVEYKVIALGEVSGNTDESHTGSVVFSGECFQKTGATYDGAATLGTTVLYYKVVRTAKKNDAWSFNANFVTGTTGTISSIKYGFTTSAITNSFTSGGSVSVSSGTEVVYFSVLVNDALSNKDFAITASNFDESSTDVTQTVITDDSAKITVSGLPTVGTFFGL